MSVITAGPPGLLALSDRDGGERCRGHLRVPCPDLAVVRAVFQRSCDCGPRLAGKCAAHRESLLADAERCLIWGGFRCYTCNGAVWLLRVQPIR